MSKIFSRNSQLILAGLTALFLFIWLFPSKYLYFLKGLSAYLPLHNFAEVFSIVIAILIFSIGWEAYGKKKSSNTIVLSIVFLVVALVDFAHMLSFQGMPDFVTKAGPEKAIYFWLCGRFLIAFGILFIAINLWKPFITKVNRYGLLIGALLLTTFIYWVGLWHQDILPRTFIAGQGLTLFKISMEWSVIVILALSLIILLKKSQEDQQEYNLKNLVIALYAMILSEVFFTMYAEVTDLFNFMGHVYKIVAYYYLYRAIFAENIKKPYEELEETNKTVSDLYDNAPCGYHSLDKDGVFLRINDTELSWLGYTREEVVGKMKFIDIVTPQSFKIFQDNFPGFKERGWVNDLEFELVRKNGEVFRVLVSGTAIKDSDGKYIMSRSTVYDITARVRAEQEVLESEEKFAAAFRSSPNLIAITRLNDGTITDVNDGYSQLLGYSREESIGKTTTSLSIWANPKDRTEFIDRLQKFGQVVNFETTLRRKDGTLVSVVDSARTIKIKGVPCVLSVVYDITGRKKSEDLIIRINRLLRMVSGINRALIHTNDEASLLNEACRVTIEVGGYQLAWIGLVDQDNKKTINLVASAGSDPDYIEVIKATLTNAESGQGPHWSAIQSGKYYISYDIATDPTAVTWSNEVLKRGYKSVIALPLKSNGDILGVFGIYDNKQGRFSDQDIEILEEMANDLSFGILNQRIRADRKKIEERLIKNKAELEEAQRIGHFGSFDWDARTDTIVWSDEYYRIYGFNPGEKPPGYEEHLKTYTPESAKKLDEAVKKSMATGQPYTIDLEQIRSDGKSKWITAHGEVKLDENKKIIGLRGTAHDITERKLAEKALMASEARLREAQHIAKIGSWELDLAKNALTWSDEIYEIFELDHQKVVGTYEEFLDAIHPDDRADVNIAYTDSVKMHTPYSIEHRLLMPDGRIKYVHERGETFYGDDDKPLRTFGTVQDITQRRIGEARLREMSKLQDTFIQIVSHQLRTPLSSIRWNLESLLAGNLGALSKEQQEFIRLTYEADTKIISTIHDLLVVIDIEEGHVVINKVEFSFESLLNSVLAEWKKKYIAKNIKFDLKLGQMPHKIFVDTEKIIYVMSNLIENAIDYTPENGSVTVAVNQTDSKLKFEVVDSGIGIPGAEQPNVFNRFYRAYNAISMKPDGSGLGLPIAKYYIEQHGGKIGFTSKEGQGSTFWFEIPIK